MRDNRGDTVNVNNGLIALGIVAVVVVFVLGMVVFVLDRPQSQTQTPIPPITATATITVTVEQGATNVINSTPTGPATASSTTAGPVTTVITPMLRVGVRDDAKPYIFRSEGVQKIAGCENYDGYYIDLLQKMPELWQNITITCISVPSVKDGLNKLAANELDLFPGAITETDERCKSENRSAECAMPDVQEGYALIGLSDTVTQISQAATGEDASTLAPFRAAGYKIVVVKNTAAEQFLGIQSIDMISYETRAESLQPLCDGTVQAMVGDKRILENLRCENGKTLAFFNGGKQLGGQVYTIAVAKNNLTLLNSVNEALKRLARDQVWQIIYKEWLGCPVFKSDFAEGISAASVCPPPTTTTHIVEKGDTMWEIAVQYCSNGFSYKLFDETKLRSGDYNKLRIGDEITIPDACHNQ